MATKEEMERMTKDQLFASAKDAGLAGFETLNKKDIIEAILNTPPKATGTDMTANDTATGAKGKGMVNTGGLTIVMLQYNGAFKGTLTKYGKTWSNLARRAVPREEADMLITEFPGRFTIVR